MEKIKNIIERLTICWYVLTRHTYAVFFCSKDLKHKECYENNTFPIFNETIADFVTNGYK